MNISYTMPYEIQLPYGEGMRGTNPQEVLLPPEIHVLANKARKAIAEGFNVEPEDVGILKYGSNDEDVAVMLVSPNPLFMGSYKEITSKTGGDDSKFFVHIDGRQVDTRGLTLEHYTAMIAQSVASATLVPDSSELRQHNKAWMATWLTGEPAVEKFAQYACVFGEVGQVYLNWLKVDNDNARYGFRPIIELNQLSQPGNDSHS